MTQNFHQDFLYSRNKWINTCIINYLYQLCVFKHHIVKSFLDIEISWEKGKFVTTVSKKRTFSGVYTHFESFLPTVSKFGMIYTLAYRCFKICSDWTKFFETDTLCHLFIYCFKTFVDKLLIKRPQLTKVEKKTLFLLLPYLGDISLQGRTKLRKSLKGLLNSCKPQIIFKS